MLGDLEGRREGKERRVGEEERRDKREGGKDVKKPVCWGNEGI